MGSLNSSLLGLSPLLLVGIKNGNDIVGTFGVFLI